MEAENRRGGYGRPSSGTPSAQEQGNAAPTNAARHSESPDPGSFGGHPYTPDEIALGYGTDHDPRFTAPAAASKPELEVQRKAVYDWARGDAVLLSARCVKTEEALESARALLLNIEGGLLGYWTDVPQEIIQKWLGQLRTELGDYELSRT